MTLAHWPPLSSLPLHHGQQGPDVVSLQRRLAGAGFVVDGGISGQYCDSTVDAVRRFQLAEGLRTTGICDEVTWNALLESGRTLGERVLALTAPMMRGEDVSELQVLLARLGFDCGKVDGIYGPDSVRALATFQRNSGLRVDGVCGPLSLVALRRVSSQTGDGPGVAALREGLLADVTHDTRNAIGGIRVVFGSFGAASGVVRLAGRALRGAGALMVPVEDPDPSVHAATANQFDAHVYLAVELVSEPRAAITYFAVPGFESYRGRELAARCASALTNRGVCHAPDVVGGRLVVLRETKMPAIHCALGPTRDLLDHVPMISSALCEGLLSWRRTSIST